MNPEALSDAVASALTPIAQELASDASLTVSAADVVLERPRQREHGDWATNVALQYAKRLGTSPRELAARIAGQLERVAGIARADVAGPGFINLRLDTAAAGELARTIVEAGDTYGHNSTLAGQRINVEFVSANPTGPLHIGHTRWAAVGDALVRVLRASGADVDAEFYINDQGAQLDRFGASVLAAALGDDAPEDGYTGEYITDLGRRVLDARPDLSDLPRAEQLTVAREIAYPLMLDEQRASLAAFNVHFDIWLSERTLHEQDADGRSAVDRAVERMRDQGHVFEADGAWWVRTTDFGDDKDRVIRRSDGTWTYFAPDAALFQDRGARGYGTRIYLLGADHHGYIHRLKTIAAASGEDPDTAVEVMIGQLVSINGAKLSKRAGNIIELDDLRDWLGTDALRYSLTRFAADSPLSLDPDILTRRTNDNPVYTVQYAHARTVNVARNAAAVGVDRSQFEPSLLSHDTESVLLGALQEFPRIVAFAAERREPHRIARYLEELAGHYHRWYDACRVTPLGDADIEPVHQTRLWVNDATGQVFRTGLGLLGVSAPERM